MGAATGGYVGWQGDIVEQLVYGRKLTSTELQQIGQYLADKYGLYNPSATWPLAYSSAVQAEITRNQWNKPQADAYVAFLTTSPAVPPTGLTMWLKANAGVTLTSGKVSNWADQSPSGNNAYQATSSLQPTVTTNSVNGEPGITFDGTGHYLRITDNATLRPSSAMTLIVAIKPKSTSPYYSSIFTRPYSTSSTWNAPGQTCGIWQTPDNYLYGPLSTLTGANPKNVQGSQPFDSQNAFVAMEIYDGSTLSFYNAGAITGSQSVSGGIDYGGATLKDMAIGVSGPYAPDY